MLSLFRAARRRERREPSPGGRRLPLDSALPPPVQLRAPGSVGERRSGSEVAVPAHRRSCPGLPHPRGARVQRPRSSPHSWPPQPRTLRERARARRPPRPPRSPTSAALARPGRALAATPTGLPGREKLRAPAEEEGDVWTSPRPAALGDLSGQDAGYSEGKSPPGRLGGRPRGAAPRGEDAAQRPQSRLSARGLTAARAARAGALASSAAAREHG